MTANIKKIHVNLHIGEPMLKRASPVVSIFRIVLSLSNLIRSAIMGGPGIGFHLAMVAKALRWIGFGLSRSQIYGLLTAPMDTFRYFEFDFFWKSVSKRDSMGDYLDVSSPRMFSWRVITSCKTHRAVILNPDTKDLSATVRLFDTIGIGNRCEFRSNLVGELKETPGSFDTVVCISVLEHIPHDASIIALKTMWELLRPDGRLLLSVPCATTAFEEYINFNEYGLLQTQNDGFVFGQRFYDEKLLDELIFSIVGKPSRMAVFGEKIEGTFIRDRERKLSDPAYPFWRESWMMATQYQYFERIKGMPGLGVVALEFVKK